MSDGLRTTLNAAIKDAMKAGDKARLSTLRLMTAAIKDKDIASRTEGHDSAVTPESGLIELFAKMVKQRQESIAVYEQGGRPELAEKERGEIAVIAAVGTSSVKDMGKVMAQLKANYAGQMDMTKAGAIVKSLLG